jgi:hypothetical protein
MEVKDQLFLFPVNVADRVARDMSDRTPLPVNSSALQVITMLALFLAKFFSLSRNGLGSRVIAPNLKALESPKEKFQIELKGLVWTSARMEEDTQEQKEIILDLLVPYKKVSNEKCEHIELDDEELECKAL